jgi:hypothetical protein
MPSANLKGEKLFAENLASPSSQFAARSNRRFVALETPSTFICTHNETLSVATMRVSNEDYSPAGVHA